MAGSRQESGIITIKTEQMGRKKWTMDDEARLRRKLTKLCKRGQSKYCEVRGSSIHGLGVYATMAIPKGTRIIEYIGDLIDKDESEKRCQKQMKRAEAHGEAAVCIFTLNKRWDIDGNVPWNNARLINHSCDPNCEAWIEGKRIFIYALRDIERGEELGFDYGFDLEAFEDHPCLCGSEQCVGYIVGRERWPELRERLEAKSAQGAGVAFRAPVLPAHHAATRNPSEAK